MLTQLKFGIPASNSGIPASNSGIPASNSGIPASNSGIPASNSGSIPASKFGSIPASNSGSVSAVKSGSVSAVKFGSVSASKSGSSFAVKSGIFALMLGTAALAFPFSHANAIELYGGFTFGNTEWEFDKPSRAFSGERIEDIRSYTGDNRSAYDNQGRILDQTGTPVNFSSQAPSTPAIIPGEYTFTTRLAHNITRRTVDGNSDGLGFHIGRVVYDGVVKVGVEGFFADLGEATAPTTIHQTQRFINISGSNTSQVNPIPNDVRHDATTGNASAVINTRRVPEGGATTGTDVISAKTYGVAARVSYQLNDVLDVYGRLGVHQWSSSRNGPTARFFFTEDDGIDPVYGVGLKYKPDPNGNGYTELGYDIYHLEDDTVAKAYLGVGVALKN